MGFVTQVVVMALATVLAAYLLPGVHVDSVGAAILTAAVIALLNNFIRPILIVLTLPFTIVSMGLFLLVINALRTGGEHLSHMCLPETLRIIDRVKPGRSLLIHMSDRMGLHAESPKFLPANVELAYDGQIVKV